MFGRRRSRDQDPGGDGTGLEASGLDERGRIEGLGPAETGASGLDADAPRDAAQGPEPVRAERGPTTGPWDVVDVPDDGIGRIDLGGLHVPVPDGLELRLDMDDQQRVVAATLVGGEDVMQVGAFAAPRREGIWDEVRGEIAEQLRGSGGSAREVEGAEGIELDARVPTQQDGVYAAARFLGVDGPRWFVRALITGPAVTAGTLPPALMEVFRQVVVVRGDDAMAPRDPLALRLPREAAEATAAAAREAAEQAEAAEAAARQLPQPPPDPGPGVPISGG